MDAPEDRDVKLQKVSGDLLTQFGQRLPELLQPADSEGGRRRRKTVDSLIALIEPFQESPQLLDPHLQAYLTPLTAVFLAELPARGISAADRSSDSSSDSSPLPPSSPPSSLPLNPPTSIHDAVAKLLYTLCKIRGPKIISRFLPNEPRWLEPLCLFAAAAAAPDTPSPSWELRYILLLWLSHLLLTPFDLSTISDSSVSSVALPPQLNLPNLPALSRRLLALAIAHLSSPGNRESDAASLLIVRLCLRKDMRNLGLLSAVVDWCLHTFTPDTAPTATATATASTTLFLKTAVLRALAGILAQGDRDVVAPLAPAVFALTTKLEASDGDEWNSANVRRLSMKIYRWVAVLSLAPEGSNNDDDDITNNSDDTTVEDIIERLLSCLGDKDTAVRFGASKSLAVISRKLAADLAGDVLEAVMGIYDEDVFYQHSSSGGKRQKLLSAVTAEKWHGATLTLATFLRQRAVRSTSVLERVARCIVDALRFEQRRATFAVGGNVRDAACYAAWSLARSYSTAELLAVGPIDGHANVQQLLATELAVAGCLDPLGNIRRAASAAMQELIGRHPNMIIEGIRVVQVVDYNAVALRRRSVITVAGEVARLAEGYWSAIVAGIIEGWRGVGSSDLDGRKLSGQGLGEVVVLSLPDDTEDARNGRARRVVSALIHRIRTEGKSDVEIWHGGTWALSEVLDGLSALTSTSPLLTPAEATPLLENIFEKLGGREFLNPILRPELTAESAARLVSALSSSSLLLVQQDGIPIKTLRLWTAIVEASLGRNDDSGLEQAVPAAKSFFRILSEKNRQRIIDSWCQRAATGRKRGYVLALGQVLDFIYHTDESLKTTVIKTLIAAAERPGEIELRVAGVRALGSGVISKEGLQDQTVARVVLKALDDYEVDSRGDVGSWARAEGIKIVFENWGGEGLKGDVNGDVEWEVVNRIVRLSVERLDRVRTRACEALLKISASWEEKELEVYIDRSKLAPDLAASSVSSREFFGGLVPLLGHPRLKAEFLKGYVTSAGAGSDSLLKTSRTVLLEYLSSISSSPSSSYISAILQTMLQVLNENTSDRIVIPALEVIAVVLEMQPPVVGTAAANVETTELLKKLFVAVQKIQYKSGNPAKLTAAVHAYAGIVLASESAGELRGKVLAKLVGMLLHPFPKLRELVAETIYVLGHCLGGEVVWGVKSVGKEKAEMEEKVDRVLAEGDWLGGTKELRKGVGILKGVLES